jgi:hypothetical protein
MCEVDGWMGYILKERLKHLKGVIKDWSKATYGEAEARRNTIIKEILELDLKSEVVGLVEEEVEGRKKLFEELWNILKNNDALIFQKSSV